MENAKQNRLVSIVLPSHNEEENVPVVFEEISRHLTGRHFEIIYVDDGSVCSTRQNTCPL